MSGDDVDDGTNGQDNEEDIRNAPPIDSYTSTSEFPRGIRPNAISVDKSHNAVLLPMFGTLVPFHVSTIKSAVKSEEGTKAFLRINFYAPGAAPGKECPLSMQVCFPNNEK